MALNPFFDGGGAIVADFGDYADVFKSGEGVVHEETLGEMGVEAGEVIVLTRDSGGGCGSSVEDLSIDPFRGVDAALDHRDLSVEGIADVGAGLRASPLVKVGDRVVVGVGDIILHPVTLEHAAGVFFVVTLLRGVFYCCNATQQ